MIRKLAVVTVTCITLSFVASGVARADVGHAKHWALRDRPAYTFLATAYTNDECGKEPSHPLYGITSRGTQTRHGVCAADPMIPFGTRLWVEGYGTFIVEDRGEAIKGMRLDLWMDDVNLARKFGRKRVRVVVLG